MDCRAERTPLRAIRARCLWCCNTSAAVRDCASGRRIPSESGEPAEPCSLYPFRFGKRPAERSLTDYDGEVLQPKMAIRAKCRECSPDRLRGDCGVPECSLWPFRMGIAGRRNRFYTDEQRAALGAHLRAARNRATPSKVGDKTADLDEGAA